MRSIQTVLLAAFIVSVSTPAFAKHHGSAHAEAHAGKKTTEEKKAKTTEMMPKSEKDAPKMEQAPTAPEQHPE